MPREQLASYLVGYVVGALINFCEKHSEPQINDYRTIVEFAIAFREGESFEWTPCSQEFRRITALNPIIDGRIAIVYDYNGLSEELTAELNEDIFEATRGILGVAKTVRS